MTPAEPEEDDLTGAADIVARPDSKDDQSEDYYMDGPYLVFTAAYHRKRGYCCNSDCRHCPFRSEEDGTL